MKILISGITGFIGRHLVEDLATGNVVYGVTRGNDADAHSTIQLVTCDLRDPLYTTKLPTQVDSVIHLAQSLEYRRFPEGVEDMRRVNIDATCELLEWARKSGVKHFIFTSSANVYGPGQGLLTEEHPTSPSAFYGASKLAAECLIQQYASYFQVDILRLFTVYGPRQRGMLIPNIIERVMLGQEITLADSVGLFLTPVYVADVMRVIRELLLRGPGASPRILNVCGDAVVTLAEIVGCVERMLGKKALKTVSPGPPLSITGCNKTLKRLLGPITFTELDAGLGCTLTHQPRGETGIGV